MSCLKMFLFLLAFTCSCFAQGQPLVLPMKERAVVQDELLEDRLVNLLPQLMRKQGVDMWLIIAREYNEDPVAKTMLPATWLHARRRTIFLLTDKGAAGVERLAVARYDIGNLFKAAWESDKERNQWKQLAKLIAERSPKKLALNFSAEFAHADGLTKAEWDSLVHYLPKNMVARITSAEKLAVDWLWDR